MRRTGTETSRRTERRTYERTHPWITFRHDLTGAPYQLWMDLGAVQSKIEHVAGAMLPPGIAEDLHWLFLARGVHGTTAIEGNTLSEEQVRAQIEGKSDLPESQAYLAREIENIVTACNRITADVLRGRGAELTPGQVREFNETVLSGLPLDKDVVPGQFRRHSVAVGKYRGAPSEDCRYLLQRLCEWLPEIQPPSSDLATGFAVLKAVLAHLYIAWIHPFGDGNGRTARLVEFKILLSGGVPSVAAHLLSNFYNQTRSEYYRQLAAASQTGGDVLPFLRYAARGMRDSLDGQIRVIRGFQWRIAWRDYVYERFRGMRGDAWDRRRLLALELAEREEPAEDVAALRRLTPEIAERYARKTPKTLTRDVNELVNMKLMVRSGRSVRANTALLTQFLPARRPDAVRETGRT